MMGTQNSRPISTNVPSKNSGYPSACTSRPACNERLYDATEISEKVLNRHSLAHTKANVSKRDAGFRGTEVYLV